MIRQKIFGSLVGLAGIICCLSGIENVVDADVAECTTTGPYAPARCHPTVQLGPRDDLDNPGFDGGGCESSYLFWCVPSPNSGCWVEGYGMASEGKCEHFLGEDTVDTDCYEGYAKTTITLQYYRSECRWFESVCQCVWVPGEYAPIQDTNCDCVIIY